MLMTVVAREDNHRDPTHRKAMDGPPGFGEATADREW
jgi:hypothetical protein